MKNIIGSNISRYRKERYLTQEQLAKELNISYQAVSKWENGQTMPDVSLIPMIAAILEISIDSLMGYSHNYTPKSFYENSYKKEDYYWGIKPADMCLKVLKLMPLEKPLSLIDIGCGEGKDAVFFAKLGLKVSAFDISDAGLEKAKRLADKANVHVDLFKANIMDFRLERNYDIIYSNGTLQYIEPKLKYEIFDNYKNHTNINGINALSMFVTKPFIKKVKGKQSHDKVWKSGELFTLYHDWYIEECSENIFDCNSGNISHKHAINHLFARKL